eukprot:UN27706
MPLFISTFIHFISYINIDTFVFSKDNHQLDDCRVRKKKVAISSMYLFVSLSFALFQKNLFEKTNTY